MPQIKEYTQRVGTEAGFSNLSVNPSIEGAAGRGIQAAGQAIGDVGETLVQIKQAKEIADSSSKVSELRLKYTKRIMDEVNTGTLSLEKLNEEFDSEFQQIGDGIITRGGSEYARRAGQELKNSLTMDAMKAESEITAVKIKNSSLKALDGHQQTLVINPTKLADVKKQFETAIREMSLNGKLIDAKVAEKIIADGNKQLDVAQFRGLIRLAPDQNLPELKSALRTGAFADRQFDDETIKKLEGEISSELSAREAEKNRVKRLTEDAEKQRDEALMSRFLEDSLSGKNQFSRLDIVRSGLTPSKAISTINFLDSYGKRLDKANSNSIKNEAYQKMLLPDGDPNKIVSIEQLSYYTQRVDADTANWLTGRFMSAKTPQEKTNAKLKSTYYSAAKKALGIDPLSKIVDPKAEEILASLTNEFEAEYAKKVSEGIAPSELLTRDGKNSLYPMIDRYRRGLNERIADLTSGMKSNVQGQKPVKADGTQMSPKEYLDSLKKGE